MSAPSKRMARNCSRRGARGCPTRCQRHSNQPRANNEANAADTAALADPSRARAGPAQDQQRRAQQADHRGQQQRLQRRLCIAHCAAHGSGQPQQEEHRSRQQQHARVHDGLAEDRCRRAQCRQQLWRETAAQGHHQHRQQQDQRHRAAGHRARLLRAARAPGLADQHHRARGQAHHQGQQQEKDREERRGRSHRLCAKQVAEIDVVQRACGQLQRIGQQHRQQQRQVGAPQRGCCRRCRMYRGAHGILWARRRPARRFRQQSKHRGSGPRPAIR